MPGLSYEQLMAIRKGGGQQTYRMDNDTGMYSPVSAEEEPIDNSGTTPVPAPYPAPTPVPSESASSSIPSAQVSFDGPNEGMQVTPDQTPNQLTQAIIKAVTVPTRTDQPAQKAVAERDVSEEPESDEAGGGGGERSRPQSVREYLQQKYGFGPNMDTAALAAAQKDANNSRAGIISARGLDTIADAISGFNNKSKNKPGPDEGYYKDLLAAATQPVADIAQLRGSQKDALTQDQAISGMAKSEADRDPASAESQAVRQMYASMFPQIVKQMPNFDHLSAADIKDNFAKPLELKQKSDDNRLKAEANGLYRQQLEEGRNNRQNERLDQMAHQRNIQAVKRDPNLRSRLQQYQNLENSLNVTENADNLTKEQIAELQQSVRSNLGIKGNSGVDEREKTYYRNLGWDAKDLAQYFSGDPASINQNDKLVTHIKNLAHLEQANIRRQYQKALGASGAGNASVYTRRPDLKADFDGLVSANMDQLSGSPAPSATGKVRVSNGKETLLIDPSDLPHAVQDGYQQVK